MTLSSVPTTLATPVTPLTHSADTTAAVTMSLLPYAGPFGKTEAWSLLRRCTFAPDRDTVAEAVGLGLAGALQRLLRDDDFEGLPLNVEGRNDPNVPIGETWIRAPYVQGISVIAYRQRSLQAWQLRSYLQGGFSLQAQLSLFWHNHFAVFVDNADARMYYQYLSLLRRRALGNVRELLGDIVTEPAMLYFLNGNENIADSPNENFARELLELYTLGKGPLVGPGDYTTYTEDDVRALARSLTGWTARGINSTDPNLVPTPIFLSGRHDAGTKQLSGRLGAATIANAGADEYQAVLDVVFAQAAMGNHIVRKLYRWFVHSEIDGQIETEVIAPLSQLLRDSNFEIRPVLQTLLSSEHFFDVQRRSAMIKNPIAFSLGVVGALGIEIPTDLQGEHNALLYVRTSCGEQQMLPAQPPTVAGWKAYYQAPLYARTWINATTLAAREAFTDTLTVQGLSIRNQVVQADLLRLIAGFDNPADPNDLITELGSYLFPERLSDDQVDALKEVLLPGLPDFEWTVEYNQHLANPADAPLAAGLQQKLRQLTRVMLTSAEAHLC